MNDNNNSEEIIAYAATAFVYLLIGVLIGMFLSRGLS
jgi:hypothetical protein